MATKASDNKSKRKKFTIVTKKKGAKNSPPLALLVDEDNTASEIMKRIRSALSPKNLALKNISAAHKKHKGAKKHGGGHYALIVVSDSFHGLGKIQREEWISSLLKDLYKDKIHALTMKLQTPEEAV